MIYFQGNNEYRMDVKGLDGTIKFKLDIDDELNEFFKDKNFFENAQWENGAAKYQFRPKLYPTRDEDQFIIIGAERIIIEETVVAITLVLAHIYDMQHKDQIEMEFLNL